MCPALLFNNCFLPFVQAQFESLGFGVDVFIFCDHVPILGLTCPYVKPRIVRTRK